MYTKVIVSGDVLEVYQMDKKPHNPHDMLHDQRQAALEAAYEFMAHGERELASAYFREFIDLMPEFMNEEKRLLREAGKLPTIRKEERLAQTLRDGRNNLRRLALMNFKAGESLFMTLTIRENSDDIDKYDNEVKKFFKRLRRRFGKFDYIGVREFQKRGALHYHFLINGQLPEYYHSFDIVSKEKELGHRYDKRKKANVQIKCDARKKIEKDIAATWTHGFVDLFSISHVDNVGAYICKYMSKDFQDKRLVGRKCYLCSRGLKRSETIGFEIEAQYKRLYSYFLERGYDKEDIEDMLSDDDKIFYLSLHNIH